MMDTNIDLSGATSETIHGLPFYVSALRLRNGAVVLWDGVRTIDVMLKRNGRPDPHDARLAVAQLEILARKDRQMRKPDPLADELRARIG